MGCAWPLGESEKKTLSDRNDRPTSQLLWVEQVLWYGFVSNLKGLFLAGNSGYDTFSY